MPRTDDRRWHHKVRHSLKRRLVALFVVLALAMSGAFLFGMQKAFSGGWRDAARPLLMDYVDRLAAEIGSPPSVQRAEALAQRLPLTVAIAGPSVNWRSHPGIHDEHERRWRRDDWLEDEQGGRLLSRRTADGHELTFGLNLRPWRDRPRFVGWATLAVLLALTAAAYGYVRHLLRPLDDIREGAQRFGRGEFERPIGVRRRDELGDLAQDVNAMASSIHQMLEAKRALLLAISHELRSPLTRARLNTELLPEGGDVGSRRGALLRDLQEMADLVGDLLEGERLGQGHAALQLEPSELGALTREVLEVLSAQRDDARAVRLELQPDLPVLPLDRTRMRLLLRNLLDNALRHSAEAPQPPVVAIRRGEGGKGVALTVRDFGPGVDEDALPHLAEPFYRPDSSRVRGAGGVGLGLYLCRLVARAHGGSLTLRNAKPGLEAQVLL